MTEKNMKVAVYCSSRDGLGAEFSEPAEALGHWIGRHGHTLLYGGVQAGLMHTVAQAAFQTGAHIVGVVPERFAGRADKLATEIVACRDLADRKEIMISQADLFVVLPGGIGTIDEWVSTLSQIMVNGSDDRRGIIVVNINDMYGPMLEQLALTAKSEFARGKRIALSHPVPTTAKLIEALDRYADEHAEK